MQLTSFPRWKFSPPPVPLHSLVPRIRAQFYERGLVYIAAFLLLPCSAHWLSYCRLIQYGLEMKSIQTLCEWNTEEFTWLVVSALIDLRLKGHIICVRRIFLPGIYWAADPLVWNKFSLNQWPLRFLPLSRLQDDINTRNSIKY